MPRKINKTRKIHRKKGGSPLVKFEDIHPEKEKNISDNGIHAFSNKVGPTGYNSTNKDTRKVHPHTPRGVTTVGRVTQKNTRRSLLQPKSASSNKHSEEKSFTYGDLYPDSNSGNKKGETTNVERRDLKQIQSEREKQQKELNEKLERLTNLQQEFKTFLKNRKNIKKYTMKDFLEDVKTKSFKLTEDEQKLISKENIEKQMNIFFINQIKHTKKELELLKKNTQK
jgi:hypothetical protein